MFEKLDVDLLYDNTLSFSQNIRPWAYTSDGLYLGLKLRYEFVLEYFEKRNKFDFKKTSYYCFLRDSEDVDSYNLYEGNASWRYTHPDLFCKRFISLINIIEKDPEKDVLSDFFKNKKRISVKVLKQIFSRALFEIRNPAYVKYNHNSKIVKKPEGNLKNQLKLVISVIKREFSVELGLFPIVYSENNLTVIGNGCHRLAVLKALNVFYDKKLKLTCCRVL